MRHYNYIAYEVFERDTLKKTPTVKKQLSRGLPYFILISLFLLTLLSFFLFVPGLTEAFAKLNMNNIAKDISPIIQTLEYNALLCAVLSLPFTSLAIFTGVQVTTKSGNNELESDRVGRVRLASIESLKNAYSVQLKIKKDKTSIDAIMKTRLSPHFKYNEHSLFWEQVIHIATLYEKTLINLTNYTASLGGYYIKLSFEHHDFPTIDTNEIFTVIRDMLNKYEQIVTLTRKMEKRHPVPRHLLQGKQPALLNRFIKRSLANELEGMLVNLNKINTERFEINKKSLSTVNRNMPPQHEKINIILNRRR